MLQSSRQEKRSKISTGRHIAEKAHTRLPLFVFPVRQFERPLLGHEERLFHALKACQRLPRKRSDMERESARFSDCETKRGHGEKEMQYYCSNCGKPCGKTYAKVFQSGAREDNLLCKACWEQQKKDASDLAKGIGYLLVHLVLPLAGIIAIFVVCGIALSMISDKFGLILTDTTKSYVLIGTATVLSIPLLIMILKTLWRLWREMHWLMKTVFCIICPPLVILVALQLLLGLFRRQRK